MKRVIFLIIISLLIAALLTVFLGWAELELSFKKQLKEVEAKGESLGFVEVSSTGGVPLDFICRGLCPWNFNIGNFIIDLFLTVLLTTFLILAISFLFRKKEEKTNPNIDR